MVSTKLLVIGSEEKSLLVEARVTIPAAADAHSYNQIQKWKVCDRRGASQMAYRHGSSGLQSYAMQSDHAALVFFISEARAPDLELRRLIAISRHKNRKRGLCGCLFSTPRYFAYIMEGTTKELSALLKTLCVDGRQAAPRILVQTSVEHRHFENWPLAHMPASEFEEALAAAYAGDRNVERTRLLLELLMQEHFENLPQAVNVDTAY